MMKSSIYSSGRRYPVRSLKELKAEKRRLQREINRAESGIREEYRTLVGALTFRNIVNTIAGEILAANLVISQAYALVKPLFRRKKKKRVKGQGMKDEGQGSRDEG